MMTKLIGSREIQSTLVPAAREGQEERETSKRLIDPAGLQNAYAELVSRADPGYRLSPQANHSSAFGRGENPFSLRPKRTVTHGICRHN
jgi:hypothetical protein